MVNIVYKDKPLASTGGSGYDVSYKNTFNPVSAAFSGGDKIAEWATNMGLPPEAAYIAFKSGACALLAAGIAGGIRTMQHMTRVAEIENDKDDPANKLKKQIGTTFKGPLGKTAEEKPVAPSGEPAKVVIPMPPPTSMDNVTNVVIPTAATILAAVGAWKGVDALADKRRNRVLTASITKKDDILKQLIAIRAKAAKGTATPAEIKAALGASDAEQYIKQASLDKKEADDLLDSAVRKFLSGSGAIILALGLTAAGGSYAYFSRSDPNNIKYKAMKKGLAEYAKSKALDTPISIVPEDAATYFKNIDAVPTQKTLRQMPEMSATRKPISITL